MARDGPGVSAEASDLGKRFTAQAEEALKQSRYRAGLRLRFIILLAWHAPAGARKPPPVAAPAGPLARARRSAVARFGSLRCLALPGSCAHPCIRSSRR
ncbi:unnamed protein product [Amoebophrya sp. A120]|nr:unnamed protein product [Amoebophrya sp. A120]|eukprot:GSA120T00010194001.1